MNERHQVYSFIFLLVKQRSDPAAVAFQSTQGAQMLQGTADHARHGSNRFEHNRSMAIPTSEERVSEEPHCLREGKCNAIGKIHRYVVSLKLRGISHRVERYSQYFQKRASKSETRRDRAGGAAIARQRASLRTAFYQLKVSVARQVDGPFSTVRIVAIAIRRNTGPETTGHSLPITSRMMMMSTTTPIAPLGQ